MDKQQVIDRLHERRFRLTQEREQLLELFAGASCMMTPAELYELSRSHQVKIGLTTVYRLLEVLTKVGAATPFLLDGNIYYAYCDGGHHHHFVCLSCHSVRDLHECPTFAKVPRDYIVQSHRADLFGICPSCHQGPEDALAGEEHNA
ncbi:transcriptional repressor [Alicyclobacillus cycloheptanicus]|uniref:Fe2+ or Zn2+ uptake regulation protein n=1 Tax=Alicyclobacillus cycloheptanicus TaxID=1457 RepID=A0ABT9XEI6_9BACL|nr:transcriptional repressor [Alicyclobacillus cycloheptanicus]MDQ0188712.1 Fe2+ or Zn2+ uptake regulation protein [Alicyclobacillus cycloheptanicus]WDM00620.1 transcriptional repressor [Alicyclobacillus cycloheptanicus]